MDVIRNDRKLTTVGDVEYGQVFSVDSKDLIYMLLNTVNGLPHKGQRAVGALCLTNGIEVEFRTDIEAIILNASIIIDRPIINK